jgi:hypothetical protein
MLFAVAAGEFACFSARCVVELVIYSDARRRCHIKHNCN